MKFKIFIQPNTVLFFFASNLHAKLLPPALEQLLMFFQLNSLDKSKVWVGE